MTFLLESRINIDTTIPEITGTAVLHNMFKDRQLPLSDIIVKEFIQPEPLQLLSNGDTSIRNQIISNFFIFIFIQKKSFMVIFQFFSSFPHLNFLFL